MFSGPRRMSTACTLMINKGLREEEKISKREEITDRGLPDDFTNLRITTVRYSTVIRTNIASAFKYLEFLELGKYHNSKFLRLSLRWYHFV